MTGECFRLSRTASDYCTCFALAQPEALYAIRSPTPTSTRFLLTLPNPTISLTALPVRQTFNFLQFASFSRLHLHSPNNLTSTGSEEVRSSILFGYTKFEDIFCIFLNGLSGTWLHLTGPAPFYEEVLGSNRVTGMLQILLRNPHFPILVFKFPVLFKHPINIADLDPSDAFQSDQMTEMSEASRSRVARRMALKH